MEKNTVKNYRKNGGQNGKKCWNGNNKLEEEKKCKKSKRKSSWITVKLNLI